MTTNPVEINMVTALVILSDPIRPEDVEPFRRQAIRLKSTHNNTGELILQRARDSMRFKLWGDKDQTYVPQSALDNWWEHVTPMQAATMMERYFPTSTSDIPLELVIDQVHFALQFSDETVENEVISEIESHIRQHVAQHVNMSAQMKAELASLIEKRLPPSGQLTTDYNALKKEELKAKHPALDVPGDVFRRIKVCMEAVRILHRKVARYGDYNALYEYRNPRHSWGRGSTDSPLAHNRNPTPTDWSQSYRPLNRGMSRSAALAAIRDTVLKTVHTSIVWTSTHRQTRGNHRTWPNSG
jgi:hypothetical protein